MENYMRYKLVGGKKVMKKSVVPRLRLNNHNVNVESIVDRVIEENEKILQGLNVNIRRQQRSATQGKAILVVANPTTVEARTTAKPTTVDVRTAAKPTTAECCTAAMAPDTNSILRDMLPENLLRKGTKRKLNTSTFDVANVCRTCLSTGELKSLYQEQPLCSRFNEMLMVCTSIKVLATDGLPLNICTNCITELNRSYTFVLKCRQTDTKLRIANKYKKPVSDKCTNMHNKPIVESQHSLDMNTESGQITQSCDPELVLIKHLPNLNHEPTTNEIATDPLEIVEFDLNIVKDEIDIKIDSYLKVKKVATINQDCDDNQLANMPPLIDMGQQQQEEEKEFQCYVCHKRFASFDRLEKHHKETHKTKVFDKDKLHICTICHKTFKYHYILKNHMRCHTGQINSCKICRATFAHESDLWLHRRVHHKLYTCRICNVVFERSVNLEKHMKSIHDILECACCQKEFNDQTLLMDHFHKNHTTLTTSLCSICGEIFTSATDLSEHMVSHTIEKTFPCKLCDRSFIEQRYLCKHMKTHKSKEIYSCPACIYCTVKPVNLAKHMFVHKGDTFLSCTVCDRAFVELPKLTEHMRTHAGEVYTCTICDTSYAKKDYLHKHMHKHTDRDHFSCPVCHKLFNSQTSIETHMSKHAQEHSFACVFCNEKFYCIADFMRHIHKYPTNVQYMCTICKIRNKEMLTNYVLF